jgi:hypothetical protein
MAGFGSSTFSQFLPSYFLPSNTLGIGKIIGKKFYLDKLGKFTKLYTIIIFSRFFTSNQKPESSSKNNNTSHRPSSGNIVAADRPGSSSALRPEDNQQPSCSSVLSPLSSQHPSNTASTTAISLQQSQQPIPSTSSSATGATDLDLPPPMDQIGSSVVVAETGEENAANGATATTVSLKN